MDSKHAASLLDTLRTLYQRHIATDLTITIEEPERKDFPVHKAVIATYSCYFRKLLEAGQLGTDHVLEGVDPSIMSLLIEFMYTGNLEVTQELHPAICKGATMLDMPLVIEVCENWEQGFCKVIQEILPNPGHHVQNVDLLGTRVKQKRRKSSRLVNSESHQLGEDPSVDEDMQNTGQKRGRKRKTVVQTARETKPKQIQASERKQTQRIRSKSGSLNISKVKIEVEDHVLADEEQNQTEQNQIMITKKTQTTRKSKRQPKIIATDVPTVQKQHSTRRQSIRKSKGNDWVPHGSESNSNDINVKESDFTSTVNSPLPPDLIQIEHAGLDYFNHDEAALITAAADAISFPSKTKQQFEHDEDTIIIQPSIVVNPGNTHKCPVCKKIFLYKSKCNFHIETHGIVPLHHKISATIGNGFAFRNSLKKNVHSSKFSVTINTCTDKGDAIIITEQSIPELFSREQKSDNTVPREDVQEIGMNFKQESSIVGFKKSQNVEHVIISQPPTSQQNIPKSSSLCNKRIILKSNPFRKNHKLYHFASGSSSKYQCGVCSQGFPLYVLCKRHYIINHRRLLTCQFCGIKSVSSLVHLQHMRLSHPQKLGTRMRVQPSTKLIKAISRDVKAFLTSKTTGILCDKCHGGFQTELEFTEHQCFERSKQEMATIQKFKLKSKLIRQILTKVKVTSQNQKFQCKLCKKTFVSFFLAKLHALNSHQKWKLVRDIKRENQTKRTLCMEEDCDFVCGNNMSLLYHVKKEHPNANYSCPYCTYTTTLVNCFNAHVIKKHENPITCNICHKIYSKKGQLKCHMAVKHNIVAPSMKAYQCPIERCQYIAYQRFSMEQHMIKHQTEKPFTCKTCGRQFKTEKNCTKHMNKIHLNIRPFICDQCGAAYGEQTELRSHMIRHSTEKQFQCEHCDYSTHDKGNLKTHLWSRHKMTLDCKQKLFICSDCGYMTDRKARFTEHRNVHDQIRKFKCPHCDKAFVTKSTLKGHIKWKHTEKDIMCAHCKHRASTRQHLKEHLRVMHTHRNVKPFKCPYCHFRCATSGNCRKHVKNRHKGKEIFSEKVCDYFSESSPPKTQIRNPQIIKLQEFQNTNEIQFVNTDESLGAVTRLEDMGNAGIQVAVLHTGGFTQQLPVSTQNNITDTSIQGTQANTSSNTMSPSQNRTSTVLPVSDATNTNTIVYETLTTVPNNNSESIKQIKIEVLDQRHLINTTTPSDPLTNQLLNQHPLLDSPSNMESVPSVYPANTSYYMHQQNIPNTHQTVLHTIEGQDQYIYSEPQVADNYLPVHTHPRSGSLVIEDMRHIIATKSTL